MVGGLLSPYWSLLTPWNPVAYCAFEDTYPLPRRLASRSHQPALGKIEVRARDQEVKTETFRCHKAKTETRGVIGPPPKQGV